MLSFSISAQQLIFVSPNFSTDPRKIFSRSSRYQANTFIQSLFTLSVALSLSLVAVG